MEVVWNDLTLDVLRAECKRRNLSVTGTTKEVYVAALQNEVGVKPEYAHQVSDTLSLLVKHMTVQQDAIVKLLETNKARGESGNAIGSLVDDEDIDNYFAVFERIAALEKWSDNVKLVKLVPKLKGRARGAYVTLPDKDAQSYELVKKAILKRFDCTNEYYRRQFRALQKLPDQSYTEFGYKLKDLLIKWLVPSPSTLDSLDYKRLLDAVALEQFYARVPMTLRVWLLDKQFTELEAVAAKADEFVAARNDAFKHAAMPSTVSYQDQNLQSRTLVRAGSNFPRQTSRRGPSAHNSVRPDNLRAPDGRIICNFCQLPGHIARICPSKDPVESSVQQLFTDVSEMTTDNYVNLENLNQQQ